jgi:hypothetical protein
MIGLPVVHEWFDALVAEALASLDALKKVG